MRTRVVAAFAIVAIIVGAPVVAARRPYRAPSFSAASLKGTWVWAFKGQLVRYQYAQLGIANFDGKGECTLVLKENSGANGGYEHNSSACTYEVGQDGIGSMEFSLDGEAGAASIAVGPKDVRLTSPDPGNTGVGVMKRAGPGAPGWVGRWTFSMEGTVFSERLGGAGVMTLDGDGGCSQSVAYNYGTGEQRVTTESCAYEIDDNGIGLADIAYSNGTGGDSFFVVSGEGELFLLTTAEAEIITGNGTKTR